MTPKQTTSWVCLLLYVVACGPKTVRTPPAYLAQVSAEHPDYPASSFICAMGQDVLLESARTGAVEAVASSIQSSIEVLRQDRLLVTDDGTTEAIERRYQKDVVQTSSFAHSDLIVPVASGAWDGTHRVYACLNRRDGADAVRGAMTPHWTAFETNVAQALQAAQDGHIKTFSTAYRAARSHEGVLIEHLDQIESIVGQRSSEGVAFEEQRARLISSAAAVRNGLSVAVRGDISAPQTDEQLPAFVQEHAVQQIQRVLSDAGVESFSGDSCEDSGGPTHLLTVQTNGGCRRGHIGAYCAPSLTLSVRTCGGKQSRYVVEDKSLRADHASGFSKLWDRLTGRVLTHTLLRPLVVEQLGQEWPLD